jgi:alanine dehydrogenase
MNSNQCLVLTRREVASLLDLDTCIDAVEGAFRLHGEGRTEPPGVLGIHAHGGGFHIKAGLLNTGRNCFVAKINGNFPENPVRRHLPLVQGVVVLCDAEDGRVLALMDSIEITVQRTAAATAVAARYLARPDASIVTICGCGAQARAQLCAVARVRPIESAFAYDIDAARAASYARDMSRELGIEVRAAHDLADAARASHIVVTCTPSRRAVLGPEDVRPGTFVAGVGADNPEKQELDPRLLAGAKVVTDILDQCAEFGDLHHALRAGVVTRAGVHAELGEVVAGRKPGRTVEQEITVFDSTGMALQDVAAAVCVYDKAARAGGFPSVSLGD